MTERPPVMTRCWLPGLLLVLGLALTGCLPSGGGSHFDLVIGSPGHEAGKFNRPRGICYDGVKNLLYVVDWDGRIQKFTRDGKLLTHWMMPEVAKGKPESLALTPRGTLMVTDTHYSRVLEFSTDGKLVHQFGSYGRDPGQFIYPVGICLDRLGDVYISEYGENDRIQKFDLDGNFLAQWGQFGEEEGNFQRPSGLAAGPDDTIYVADAVNHRVQVFDLNGKLLKIIGRQGRGPGEFTYPYDVAIRPPFLYVLEYGNHRVQKLKLDGEPVAMFGGPGKGDGCFAAPWRFTVAGKDDIYVSDTNNSRVARFHF